MREKSRQEVLKCHQHKGCESVKPAVQAEGLEGRRGGIRDQGRGKGYAERGDPREAAADRISHQSAEAVTE